MRSTFDLFSHVDPTTAKPIRAHVQTTAQHSTARDRGIIWTASLWLANGNSIGWLDAPKGHKTSRQLIKDLAAMGCAVELIEGAA